jgi:hypothetical protein
MKDQVHIVAVVIPLLAVLVVAAGAAALARFASSRAAVAFVVGAVVWGGVSGGLAASGILGRFEARPPPILLFMAVLLVGSVALGLSSTGGLLASRAPLVGLVGVQAFRLPLELAMHQAATDGIMPVELSFSGYNFDIVTGVLAVVVVVAWRAGLLRRWMVWLTNIVGIAALLAIVAIALLTSPMLHAFGTDPAHLNTWVAEVPYVWLPAMLVAFAVAGHVVITRALLLGRRA